MLDVPGELHLMCISLLIRRAMLDSEQKLRLNVAFLHPDISTDTDNSHAMARSREREGLP